MTDSAVIPSRLLVNKDVPHGAVRLWAMVQIGYDYNDGHIPKSTLHRWIASLKKAGYPIDGTVSPIGGTIENPVSDSNVKDLVPVIPSVGQKDSVYINKEVHICTVRTYSFEDFYGLYPRKVGKKAALKAWSSLKVENNPALSAEIINGLTEQVEAWSRDNTEARYIPHPSTWLNGHRWEDQVITPEQQPQLSNRSRKLLDAAERFVSRREGR